MEVKFANTLEELQKFEDRKEIFEDIQKAQNAFIKKINKIAKTHGIEVDSEIYFKIKG